MEHAPNPIKAWLRKSSALLLLKRHAWKMLGLDKAALKKAAAAKNIHLALHPRHLDFSKGRQVIRIAPRHVVYGHDIINAFDYYFQAVKPEVISESLIVDYSQPKFHEVIGYAGPPVFFSALSEPLVTTQQYLDFAKLENGCVVLDLGAYSGLTALVFSDRVAPDGRVIAVEADEENIAVIKKNLENYKTATGRAVDLVAAAVWTHNRGVEFSVEGNMGSSAVSIVGRSRGTIKKVASMTLSELATAFALDRVDFVKCDIEGAEALIFNDEQFFSTFKPRIIVEVHMVNGVETTAAVTAALQRYGYQCQRVVQHGVELPLLECYPPDEATRTERSPHPRHTP